MSAELRKNRSTFIHAPILAEIVARLKAGEPAMAQYLGGKQACFPRTVVGLSPKCQIRRCAAKRGLPPIPAFGIGWLYPVCLRLILRQSRALFSSPRMRCSLITRLTRRAAPQL